MFLLRFPSTKKKKKNTAISKESACKNTYVEAN